MDLKHPCKFTLDIPRMHGPTCSLPRLFFRAVFSAETWRDEVLSPPGQRADLTSTCYKNNLPNSVYLSDNETLCEQTTMVNIFILHPGNLGGIGNCYEARLLMRLSYCFCCDWSPLCLIQESCVFCQHLPGSNRVTTSLACKWDKIPDLHLHSSWQWPNVHHPGF